MLTPLSVRHSVTGHAADMDAVMPMTGGSWAASYAARAAPAGPVVVGIMLTLPGSRIAPRAEARPDKLGLAQPPKAEHQTDQDHDCESGAHVLPPAQSPNKVRALSRPRPRAKD